MPGCLRRAGPPPAQLLRAAAAEGVLDAVDRATLTALHLAAARGLEAAVADLLLLGARVGCTDPNPSPNPDPNPAQTL